MQDEESVYDAAAATKRMSIFNSIPGKGTS